MDNVPIVTCLLLFLLMTAIVLLNLMIAMFSDTYERIQTQAVHQWALNFAQSALTFPPIVFPSTMSHQSCQL
jgi:sensor histidine kinase regulating citrate/malate metabolism